MSKGRFFGFIPLENDFFDVEGSARRTLFRPLDVFLRFKKNNFVDGHLSFKSPWIFTINSDGETP